VRYWGCNAPPTSLQSFDDFLLVPLYSDVLPMQVDTKTMLTRHIELQVPLVSAPMDTVTEAELRILR